METKIYNPRIGWYLYAGIPFIVGCMIALILTEPNYLTGLILLTVLSIFIYSLIITTKYAVRGNEFGVKYLYRWHWYPIEKIESITTINSYLSSSTALSNHRIAIKFSDRNVLKSYAPLEISPKNTVEFIAELLKINPGIKII